MTVIPANKIKFEIVSSAIDDITGLYEVIWALNTLYPDITNTEKINYCKPAIIDLIQSDIISLYKRNWNTQVEQKLEKKTALEIVMDDDSWDVPSEKSDCEYYCFLATDGKALEEENRLYVKINSR